MTQSERLLVECLLREVRDVVSRVVPQLIERRLEELVEEIEDFDEWRRLKTPGERSRTPGVVSKSV
jgi:hypothetical protein